MEEKANILIIGGAGYIGSHIAVEHLNKNHNVIIVDNLQASDEFIIENIKEITGKEFTFYAYNATNETLMEKIFEENKIDIVVHMAGNVSTVRSMDNPIDYLDNNINTLLTTLKLMRKFEVKNLVYGSSSKVYGKSCDEPMSEINQKKIGGSPYAVSKQVCEDILQTMGDKMSIAILRFFNPIGCHSSGKIGCLPKTGNDNILNSLFDSYLTKNQFLIKGDNYRTSDGTCIRDYINIDDIVAAHMKAVNWIYDSENVVETFNVCTGKGLSVKQVVAIFESEMDEKINIMMSSRRKGGLGIIIGNPEKANNILNFSAKSSVKASIKNYLNWYNYVAQKIETSE